jgi:hypothetical protein
VAAELSCDWHTVNDAVITYGQALIDADHKRLDKPSAIGRDETSFVRLVQKKQTSYQKHRLTCMFGAEDEIEPATPASAR